MILACVGRKPVIPAVENIDLKSEKGRIEVDDFLKTCIPNIYAAGDCTAKCMLAHFAAYQGRVAAHNIVFPQKQDKAAAENIPNCVFTNPEVASVGLSEEAAKNKNMTVKINKFDFLGSGMARILEEAEGFIKIISDSKTEQVIGASIIGPKATELIGILTVAIRAKMKTAHLRDAVLAHPTLSEGITEALN
jgi:dihydrolipoamide dehydrogenase